MDTNLLFSAALGPSSPWSVVKTRFDTVTKRRPGGGFTLLLEAMIVELARRMPMLPIARLLGVDDKRVWRVVHHYNDGGRR